MKKATIKAGIIGSGFAARFHCEAMKRAFSVNVEIVGAYSRNPDKLKKFTGDKQISAFATMDELIAGCDIVHVCTPPVTHEPICIEILKQNKHVIIEKPFTGYFGDGSPSFNGDDFSREAGLEQALDSIRNMLEAEKKSKGMIMYAENWVYAPAIQKEREIIEKTGAQVLWIMGEESHSGSHSADYGHWRLSGGGSLMGKGCHPLAAAIYLKHVEGRAHNGTPIRPRSVSCRTHTITRMPGFRNEGHLRDAYTDIEDFAAAHITFEDGTMADIFASELVNGGVKNHMEINANNHRTVCNIGPNNAMQTYNPVETNFKDIYVVEKTGTKQGWSNISPDEGWFNGYQHEVDAFYSSAAYGVPVESNSRLAADVIATIYSGYVSAERKGSEVQIPIL